jgi:hypothetical protein
MERNNLPLSEASYSYRYPGKRNLKPGSKLHDKIIENVLERARASRASLSERFDAWKSIDNMLTAYVRPTAEDMRVSQRDPDKPTTVVIPTLYAVLETLLTYNMEALAAPPIYRYGPTGPEDIVGAMVMEKVVNVQANRAKVPLSLYLQWRSDFAYGFGVTAVRWNVEKLRIPNRNQPVLNFDTFQNPQQPNFTERTFEGNVLDYIDPYAYLPDPNYSVTEVQRGEFVGWIASDSYYSLLVREQSREFFNVKYLPHASAMTTTLYEDYNRKLVSRPTAEQGSSTVDIIYMYVRLIPAEWGLSGSTQPEMWWFAVAGDSVVLQAQRLDLMHNMFPVAVCSSELDGINLSPKSKLERVYGLQKVTNWLVSSHIANVRKSLNDMFLVDPSMVNMDDLYADRPGRFIRLKPKIMGRTIDDALKQLNVQDITRQHISESAVFIDMINKVTGAVDKAQGIRRSNSGDVSAQEAYNDYMGAISKLAKNARLAYYTSLYDQAYLMAMHTQQFANRPATIQLSEGWAKLLQQTYGDRISQGIDGQPYLQAWPDDLQVGIDVMPNDGGLHGAANAQAMLQLYQMAVGDQEVRQKVDIIKLFYQIAQTLGYNNISTLQRVGPPSLGFETMDPEQLLKQVQQGNLVQLGGQQ